MKLWLVPNVDAPHAMGPMMLKSIAAFFRGLFARKDDNFKALLIADLGIER